MAVGSRRCCSVAKGIVGRKVEVEVERRRGTGIYMAKQDLVSGRIHA